MAEPNGKPGVSGAGVVLDLIRAGVATTRADIVEQTGMARSTVAQRLDALTAHRLVRAAEGASTGGRPATTLSFNHAAGVVLAADLGATHSRVAVTDLGGDVLAEEMSESDIAAGPEPILGWLERCFEALLEQAGRSPSEVRGVGVGVPGPVEFATGRPVAPPIMPGWDGYPVAERLRGRFGGTVLIDNDVNIMARGEHAIAWPGTEHLLYVKVGTGIGAGIVAGGRIHRGEQGVAGDIGHIRVSDQDELVCGCGNTGCLEAVAGGRALAQRLTAAV